MDNIEDKNLEINFNEVQYACQKQGGLYKEDIKTSDWGGITPIGGKIYWHLEEASITKDMPKYKVLFAINEGFRLWQKHFNISLEPTNDARKAAIIIRFRNNGAKDLPEAFAPNVLAYAFFPYKESLGLHADVYMNDAVNWAEMHKSGYINLMKVFVHELGHSFGLHHSDFQHDIMFWRYQPNNSINIGHDTVDGIEKLYGEVKNEEPNDDPTKEDPKEDPKEEPKDDPVDSDTIIRAFLNKLTEIRGDAMLSDLREDELLIIAEVLGIEATKKDKKKDTVAKLMQLIEEDE